MKERPPISKPSKEKVLRLYASGKLTIRGVGIALGVTPAEAKNLLNLYGLEPRHGKRGEKEDEDDF